MARLRNLPWKLLIAVFIVSMVAVLPTSASSTMLSVEPPSIIDVNLIPGETFSVNVTIADVVDLTAYEFKLGYDTSVLTATGITIGDFFSQYKIWIEEINDAEGYVKYSVSLPFKTPPLPGVSGSGILATVDFTVDSYGESALDLDGTKLVDSNGYPIYPEVYDGYFSNTGIGTPVADFTFEPTMPIAKANVTTFDASASYDPDGNIVSYEWDFGDSNIGSGMIVEHLYEETGIYTVILKVTDNDDVTGEASVTIEVIPPRTSKADLAEWMAKPEHRHFDREKELSRGEDLINDLYAEVEMLGYNRVWVWVLFTIYDGKLGTEIAWYYTETVTLTTYPERCVLEAQFDTAAWGPGRYYVKAQCFYWSYETGTVAGTKVKMFSFKVV